MKRHLLVVSASCLLALAGSNVSLAAMSAPPTDAQVQDAAKAFAEARTTKSREAMEKKERLSRDAIAQMADESLKDIEIASLTVAQLKSLSDAGVLMYTTKNADIGTRIGELAKTPDAGGFEAAVMGLSLVGTTTDEAEETRLLQAAIKHPGATAGLKAGKGATLFRALSSTKPGVVKTLAPDLLALESVFVPGTPAATVLSATGVLDALMKVSPDDVAKYQSFRTKLLAAVRDAGKAEGLDDRTKSMIPRYETKLEGAWYKGTLMNQPVPAMDITWSNLDPQVKTVADLKGKVVVLDFWATWCGPCIGSFPDVKKLQDHYEGYPVVILGVTSLQGSFNTGKTTEDGKAERIDCKDKPELEMSLMPEYLKTKDINWKIAFTKQDVFNPDFGVNGIPHVAIIDAKGIVRERGLHPSSRVIPFEDKVGKIDALLKEAGLPTPPAPVKEEKKVEPKGG